MALKATDYDGAQTLHRKQSTTSPVFFSVLFLT
jgi:hypothetical protein